MGYKVFTAGQEALAADVNTLLMSQTVSRFPSAATRAADLTAPATGQLSTLDDRQGAVQVWNGAAWVDQSTIAQSGFAPYVQWGTNVVTTDAFGSANIAFPIAFASANRAVIAMNGDASSQSPPYSFHVGLLNPANTAAGFTVACLVPAGGVANTAVRINWIAIGVRP